MDARQPREDLDPTRLTRMRAAVLRSPDLPAMPAAYGRLLQVVASERSTPQDLVEVLELDPALAARVLRLANSAFLGVPGSVSSLTRAVLLLGWKWVANLALGVTVWSTFATRGNAPALRLWGHAARVALAGRLLARHLALREAESAFSAGLLHDVGRAVLALRHRGEAEWIASPDGDVDLAVERERFGVDHATVGSWLATEWRLPDPLVEAIGRHHDPLEAGDDLDVLTVVRLADLLIHDVENPEQEVTAPEGDLAATIEALAPERRLIEVWADVVETVRDEGRDLEQLFSGPA